MKKFLWLLSFLLIFGCGNYEGFTIDPTPDSEIQEYPLNLSWGDIDTNNDGVRENYITPIKKQPCKDCYIYAALGLLEIQYQIDFKTYLDLDLSEQSIHNCLKISCSDTGDDRTILEHVRKYGVMEESYAPTGTWGTCNNCLPFLFGSGTGITTVEHIPFFSFRSWRTITYKKDDPDDMRRAIVKALQTGPVSIHISGWSGLKREGDILYCSEWNPGGHVVVVVGYRYHGKVLLIKNSHGEAGLLRLVFENADICGIGDNSIAQISPGSTYATWGLGEQFCYSMEDSDKDGVPNAHDNCPSVENVDQKNADGDMFGDVCDKCPNDFDRTNNFYCAPKN